MIRKAFFYVLLGVATVGLSHFLGAWRAWRAAPTPLGGVDVVLSGLVTSGAMLALGFVLYKVDRAAGRVRRRVGLYEWVIRSWRMGAVAEGRGAPAGGRRG